MGDINVAILGVGNCASSLVQGLHFYEDIGDDASVPGLMNPNLGGYRIRDVDVVCGFDVDARKVGKDVAEAIYAEPNCAMEGVDPDEMPTLGAPVYMAPVDDGVARTMDEVDEDRRYVVAGEDPVDPATKLDEHDVDVLVNLLPVGSQRATERWMEAALETRTAVVNCIPVFVASDDKWSERFEQAGVPILGDDIKSQVGATITHRVLSNMFNARGAESRQTYQLNVGGNTDFLTLQDASRLESKTVSKTQAVQSQLDEPMDDHDIKIAPSDYVPFLEDNKIAFIRMQGSGFMDAPIELELRLSVEDSPNSAGVVIDALRCAKLALDAGEGGPVEGPSSFFFKSPPTQYTDEEARERVRTFVDGTSDEGSSAS